MNFEKVQKRTIRFGVVFGVLLASALAGRAADESSPPLPTVKEVLKQIVERSRKEAENDRQFDERYGYRRVKTREVRSTKGKLKQRKVTTTFNQAPDGNRLAESEGAVTVRQGHLEDQDGETTEDSNQLRSRGDYGRKDFPINDELLSRFEFTMAGRETVNGRPALVLDFKPADRELPNRTFLDRFVNRVAGRLWVDEADFVLARADLKLTESVSFLAGIAGAVYQLEFKFERSRMDDGLWYTPEFAWRVDWRELFSRKVVSVQETKDDVRPAAELKQPVKESAARNKLS